MMASYFNTIEQTILSALIWNVTLVIFLDFLFSSIDVFSIPPQIL